MNANPFRRRAPAETPVESALRRSLARNAFDAPDADDLARRILAATDGSDATDRPDAVHGERPSRGPWKTWGLPLVAAASVAAVVGIGVAVASYHPGDDHGRQAASQVPSTAHATVTTTQTVTAPAPAARSMSKQAAGTPGLTNVKILDLTFFSRNDGVALASADCLRGPGRCTALLQTSNGRKWTSKGGNLNFDVRGVKGCPASRCVDHIRLASASVGYAYGPDALFMTTDGGENWHRESGGAEALETLDDNVIRVSTATAQCPPACAYTVQTAGIGSLNWTPVSLPGGTPLGDGVQLSRGGSDAYLLVTRNPAGGAADEQSTLFRSTDDGASWTGGGEPCPQQGGEVDSSQVAAGIGSGVSVLCSKRTGGPYRVAVSTDAGANFTRRTGAIAHDDVADTSSPVDEAALASVLAGDPTRVLAVAGQGVSISRDGGASWHQAADLVGRFASVGFESANVGRAVSADGSQIWTTRDAGRTWHESTP